MKLKKIAVVALAVVSAATMGGCAPSVKKEGSENDTEIVEREPQPSVPPSGGNEVVVTPLPPGTEEQLPGTEEQLPEDVKIPTEEAERPSEEEETPPAVQTVRYISVTGANVNLRSGAGTSYSVLGSAEKDTLYSYEGEVDGWYKTTYRNKTVYISSKYCVVIDMPSSGNPAIEAVIAEGTNLLGTPYVYGAVRLHDGAGNLYRGFSINAFDCSSLMQYMFYYGAGYLLQVNTRTQVYQGKTVTKSQLQRGDLMFFTNSSRYNKTGIERIGHVAIYLGDNYILHTASDYAKIEQISAQRWSYFIQAQRIL